MKVTVEEIVQTPPPKEVVITLSMEEAQRLMWILFRTERVPIYESNYSLFSILAEAGLSEVKPPVAKTFREGMPELSYENKLYHIADEAQ